MNQRIAINGFGRIGRTVLRAWTARESLRQTVSIAAINEIADPETVAHLTQYDSTHGRFPGTIARTDDALIVNGQSIALLRHTHIDKLPWRDLGIDLVIESTGAFSDRVTAEQHIHSGARRVLFSQPAQSDVDATIVWGLNQSELQGNHQIISAGSCTTNALAPLLRVLHEAYGVLAGHMTTIHCYTGSQPTVDAPRGAALERNRAAALSMVPTSTSAAVLIDKILPELAGRVKGCAVRVPNKTSARCWKNACGITIRAS